MPGLLRAFSLLLLAALLGSSAPGADAAQRTLRFERQSMDEGMLQFSILSILQDRQGFIWFGSQGGLHRYDGYTLTVFRNDANDPASIPDNYVSASWEDADGMLWFGTKGGLARFDPATRRFQRYALHDEGRSVRRWVTAIVPGADGALWLATNDGVVRFEPATGRHRAWTNDALDPDSLRDNRISALAFDGNGALWVGTQAGLARMETASGRFTHFLIGPPGDAQRNNVLALSMGPRETLWIGTESGLDAWRVDEATPRRQHIGGAEGMGDTRIMALYHDAGANLWVGTDNGGLKWRDPSSGRFTSYEHAPQDRHSLSDNQVLSILVDRTGTLWVGTYFGGLNRTDLASGGFARFGGNTGAGNVRVRAIVEDADQALWVCTTGEGLLRLDPETRKPRRIGSAAMPGNVVTALALARGRLWIGTPTGLLWRDPAGRYGRVELGAGPGAQYVQTLYTGRDGTLWILTRDGLSALAPGAVKVRSWQNEPLDPGSLGDNFGLALLEDRQGILWVGTQSGLERFDREAGTFTRFRHDPQDPGSLRHSRVYSLLETADGTLWVGTAGGLHSMVRDGARTRFRFYPFGAGSQEPAIGAVLADADGILWASTTVGITRLDPASGEAKNYTAKDGLTDGAYFVGAGWRSMDGELHFGGINGMTSFQPSAVRDNPYPPQVVITDLLVLNRSLGIPNLAAQKALALSYRDSVFTLEFAALHFADPNGNRYAYQLEGFDRSWVEASAARRYATYTNLDPGRYVFRVRGSNKDGVWSPDSATLAITITPPYWKTWWFRSALAALVLLLSWLAYRLRVRALVEQKRMLAREVDTRTGELLLQKEAALRQKEIVERAHRNIALLSDMGRVLTANLDNEAIMATLHQHVLALMDAPGFAVGLRRIDRAALELPFAVTQGTRCARRELPFDPGQTLLAACIASGTEILLRDVAEELPAWLGRGANRELAVALCDPAQVTPQLPGALLCVPISAGRRVLGAVMVQSPTRGAYNQVHLDMLGTLAAYVGVAMDNAEAYHRLKQTQAQLAAQEKLASLGSLVAGVAHELNTPIGNSLLMASTLAARTDAVAARFQEALLKRSDLEDYMASAREASELIMRSLHNAAELVSSFRQVSVDQASAQRREYDLGQACQEIAATLMNTVRLAGHSLQLAIPGGIVMDGFPGPLGQVIINFVNNALLHAFDGPGGTMLLSAFEHEGQVRLTFRDDGCGIDSATQGRIFDPFFTTRMGQGGTGLGLNIVYNIVTTLMGGAIRVESAPGEGTAFVIELPLRAPEAAPPAERAE